MLFDETEERKQKYISCQYQRIITPDDVSCEDFLSEEWGGAEQACNSLHQWVPSPLPPQSHDAPLLRGTHFPVPAKYHKSRACAEVVDLARMPAVSTTCWLIVLSEGYATHFSPFLFKSKHYLAVNDLPRPVTQGSQKYAIGVCTI